MNLFKNGKLVKENTNCVFVFLGGIQVKIAQYGAANHNCYFLNMKGEPVDKDFRALIKGPSMGYKNYFIEGIFNQRMDIGCNSFRILVEKYYKNSEHFCMALFCKFGDVYYLTKNNRITSPGLFESIFKDHIINHYEFMKYEYDL